VKTLRRVSRRAVVEAYVAYDAQKKGLRVPNLSKWDWTSADAIDSALRSARFKDGVPAGYSEWDHVSLTVDDLRACAVVASISGELGSAARDLGTLEAIGRLAEWQPTSADSSWLSGIESGKPLSADEPMLLRAATPGEAPAHWYLEDGSGRATAIVKNSECFEPGLDVALGYLGAIADHSSTFMQRSFPELLDAGISR
jgi:hypothetical protein